MRSLNYIKNVYICSLHIIWIWDIGVKIKQHFFSSLQEISLLFLTSLMSKEKNAQILESRISKLVFFFIN